MADFVKHLKSNIRGGMDLELAPCTLLIGKSGSGKSAVIDALALAGTGVAYTKGLGKDPKRLMGLAPDGEDELYSSAVLSSGDVLAWKTEGAIKTTSWQRDSKDIENPPIMFVSGMASTLLFGDGKRIQQAMIVATKAELASHKILANLPAVMHVELERIFVEELNMPAWGVTAKGTRKAPNAWTPKQLTEAIRVMSALKSQNNKRLKVLSVEGGAGASFPLSDTEEAELQQLSKLSKQTQTADPEELRARLAECEADIQGKRDQMLAISPKGAEYLQKRRSVLSMLQAVSSLQLLLAERYDGKERAKCTVCASAVTVVDYQAYCQKVQDLTASVAREVETAGAGRREWLGLRDSVQVLREAMVTYERSLAGASPSEGYDQDRLRALTQRKRQAANAQASAETLPLLERANAEYTAIKEVLEVQLATMADQAAAVTEKKLNKFLPKYIRAKIVVEGGKRAAVSIRVSIHGGPSRDFRVLSGAQQATLIAAVASATIPPDAPPVRVMVIDDIWIDSTAYRNLMNATTRAVERGDGFTQAIFCAVSWGGKAPAGWAAVHAERPKDEQESTYTHT